MTVCQVKRNDAEKRVRDMAQNGWKSTIGSKLIEEKNKDVSDIDDKVDFEELARDQIAKLITAKYKGHGMAQLVDGILRAQGYTTFVSPPGPDKGVDILAAQGPMGFGDPKICVQVKSGDGPLDRPTLDQLIGSMQNVQANQGLLVSWGGFKSSVDKEKSVQFFKVRLWDQADMIEQLLKYYDKLDEDLKAELPLKRIWAITTPDSESD
jgi:restriction system protein